MKCLALLTLMPLLTQPLCALPAIADQLPRPPVPPPHSLTADQAPVPDVTAQDPVRPPPQQTSVDVRLYRAQLYDPSMGFAPGSRYQSNEDRKPIQTPGFSVTVPLK